MWSSGTTRPTCRRRSSGSPRRRPRRRPPATPTGWSGRAAAWAGARARGAAGRGGRGGAGGGFAAAVARASIGLLARGVRELFGRYIAELTALGADTDGRDAEVEVLLQAVAGDHEALSWLVASEALLTTEDRQALLAESATRRRLVTESRLLRRELTLLQSLGAVPAPLRRFATPMTVN